MARTRMRTLIALVSVALSATAVAYPGAVASEPATGAAAAAEATLPMAAELRGALERYRARHPVEQLDTFYAQRGYTPLWVGNAAQRGALRALTRVLTDADREGLDAERYVLASGYGVPGTSNLALLADLEVRASADLVRYVMDLRGVHPDSTSVRHEGAEPPETLEATGILGAASTHADVESWLRSQAPASEAYANMRLALAQYRALRSAGGWGTVPRGRRIEPGRRDARIPAVRARLRATGELAGTAEDDALLEDPKRYDPVLVDAVRDFQTRHGLAPDGIIGKKTQRALTASVEDRINQIAANMERERWLPADLGRRHVLVNVPQYELKVMEDDREVMAMSIIVGRQVRKTPIFSGKIDVLEFNPYWYVPESIARKDLLPKLIEDPWHLEEAGMRIFEKGSREELSRSEIDFASVADEYSLPYRMRQDPGPENALGRVKFLFRNPYAVYLHDTPGRNLFGKHERAFSSGCIRVERPLEMAEYLLRDTNRWSRPEIDDVLDDGARTRVELPEPVHVHLIYRTAWLGEDGRVHFRRDIYGRDSFLADKLIAVRAGMATGA